MPTLIYEERPGEIRTAWLVDGAPRSLLFRRAHWPAAGDVHLARVLGHAPDGSGAFVLLRADGLTGFLKRRARMPLPPEGQQLCVRVEAFDPLAGDKAARVRADMHLCGRYVMVKKPGGGIDCTELQEEGEGALAAGLRSLLDPLAGECGIRIRRPAAHVAPEVVLAEAQRLTARIEEITEKAKTAEVGRLHRPSALLAALAEGPPGPVRLAMDVVGAAAPEAALLRKGYPDVHVVGREAGLSFTAAGLDDWLETVAAGSCALPGGGALRFAPAPTGLVVDVDAGGRPARGDRTRLLQALGEEAADCLARTAAALRMQGLVLVDLPVRAGDSAMRHHLARRWRAAFAAAGLGRDIDGPNRHGVMSIALRRRSTPILAFLDMAGLPERLRREARLFAALRPLAQHAAASPAAVRLTLRLPEPLIALAARLGLVSAWEQALHRPLVLEPL